MKFRDILLRMGVFDLTVKFLEQRSDTQYHYKASLRHAVWVLSNLCRDKPPENFQVTFKAFPVFCMVIDKIINEVDIFRDSSFAMKQLALIYLSEF